MRNRAANKHDQRARKSVYRAVQRRIIRGLSQRLTRRVRSFPKGALVCSGLVRFTPVYSGSGWWLPDQTGVGFVGQLWFTLDCSGSPKLQGRNGPGSSNRTKGRKGRKEA